jgi:hypothetical protein
MAQCGGAGSLPGASLAAIRFTLVGSILSLDHVN